MPHLRVLAAGSNAHGQLANETYDDSHVFQPCVFAQHHTSTPKYQLPGDRVHAIACGANHTLLLVELERPSGESHAPVRQLWGCGNGLKGQLGPDFVQYGSRTCRSSIFWRLDHTIMAAANIDEDIYTVSEIAAAWESTFIVFRPKHQVLRHSRDIVIAMGNNDHGDLGIGLTPAELKYTPEPRRVALDKILETVYPNTLSGFHITNLAAGLHHVVATMQLFLQDGEEQIVVGWGATRHQQLGSLPSSPRLKFEKTTRVSPFTSNPYILSLNQKGAIPDAKDPVVKIALGSHHSVFLHHSGRITGLGSNRKGQLAGLDDITRTIKDVGCTWNGTYLTIQNGNGNPGLDHPEREIQATGFGDKGQLGRSTSTPGLGAIQFPFKPDERRLVDIACGSEHVLVLVSRSDGVQGFPRVEEAREVWACGWNEHGNFGLEHTVDAHLPVIIWPLSGADQGGSSVQSIWAGCGTSWIVES